MKLTPVYRGAPVQARGTAVRTRRGIVLVDPAHLTADLLTGPPAHDLDFAVRLAGDNLDLPPGRTATVRGLWADHAIAAQQISPADDVGPLPGQAATHRDARAAAARPARAPGPPTALERQLLADGTLAGRLPYADGTLHVVADDPAHARALLEPEYGPALRVHRAVYSQQQRHQALTALRTAAALGVVCAAGDEPLDDDHPTETVHTLEVVWVSEELADALAAVPDGLVRVTSHVTVTPS